MFTLPNLPFPPDALEPYIDEETMRIHHDLHHASYVKNLNDLISSFPNLQSKTVESLISELDSLPEAIRQKVRNNGGGHYNHSLFWQLLAPGKKGNQPKGALMDAIRGSFGDFDTFKERFTGAAIGRFGSGWVWLVSEKGHLSVMDSSNQDIPFYNYQTSVVTTSMPILCLDVWEHAYYLKYHNRRADYISAWWNVVNWQKAEKMFLALAG